MTLKKVIKPSYQVEDVEESIQLKTKKAAPVKDVESGATFKFKPFKIKSKAEDVEQQFQIGLKPAKKPEQPQETQDVEEKLTIKRKPKQSVEEKLPHRWK